MPKEHMADTLQNMIDGTNSNNLFMQCDSPNQEAFHELPEGFTSRLCKRDEIIIWKEMWAQGKYMEFVNFYYDKMYALYEEEFLFKSSFVLFYVGCSFPA